MDKKIIFLRRKEETVRCRPDMSSGPAVSRRSEPSSRSVLMGEQTTQLILCFQKRRLYLPPPKNLFRRRTGV